MAEKIIDKELLEQIISDDIEGYEVIDESIIEQTRWAVLVETIFKREADGRLFMAGWRRAATEMQENDYPDEAVECEAYDKITIAYREVA